MLRVHDNNIKSHQVGSGARKPLACGPRIQLGETLCCCHGLVTLSFTNQYSVTSLYSLKRLNVTTWTMQSYDVLGPLEVRGPCAVS